MGDAITQTDLANYKNQAYQTNLIFNSISFQSYLAERKEELGNFIGTLIAGIYEGVHDGANDVFSDYERATGSIHKPIIEMITSFKK